MQIFLSAYVFINIDFTKATYLACKTLEPLVDRICSCSEWNFDNKYRKCLFAGIAKIVNNLFSKCSIIYHLSVLKNIIQLFFRVLASISFYLIKALFIKL